MCVFFDKTEAGYAYKRYAFKKKHIKPFLNPYWYLDCNGSMIIAIFFQRNFTELFETTGKTLAGR